MRERDGLAERQFQAKSEAEKWRAEKRRKSAMPNVHTDAGNLTVLQLTVIIKDSSVHAEEEEQ